MKQLCSVYSTSWPWRNTPTWSVECDRL